MHSDQNGDPVQTRDDLSTLAQDPWIWSSRSARGRTEADNERRVDDLHFGHEPRTARCDLAGGGVLVVDEPCRVAPI